MHPPVFTTTAEQGSRLNCSGPDAFSEVPPEIKSLHFSGKPHDYKAGCVLPQCISIGLLRLHILSDVPRKLAAGGTCRARGQRCIRVRN